MLVSSSIVYVQRSVSTLVYGLQSSQLAFGFSSCIQYFVVCEGSVVMSVVFLVLFIFVAIAKAYSSSYH